MSDKEIIKIFMENLNKYMNANDVTQADVARYMGVSTSTVAGWCNGLIIPRMDKVQRLAANSTSNASRTLTGIVR